MGHSRRRPIRLGGYGLVFPALLLTCLGQGTLRVENPTAIVDPSHRRVSAWAVLRCNHPPRGAQRLAL